MKVCALCVIGDTYVFTLPKLVEVRERWVKLLRRINPNIKITSSLAVCADHFHKDDFTNFSMVKLMPGSSKLR